jgi:glutamate/tyrosine decarboxylase-like PLP-dependent enzyme
VVYVSSEGHHSIVKAVRLCGLGSAACRIVPVEKRLQMDVAALRSALEQDRRNDLVPLLIAGTAGTTSAGVIDPLSSLAEIADAERCWFHVDATWGGAAALSPELRPTLAGIERADSIAFDAHKWLSVPMGAGLFLTRHPAILTRTFHTQTEYMPRESDKLGVVDPYSHSIEWSRRFIGLKVFLSLAVAGWDGYAAAIRHMTAMGDRLRRELDAADWEVVNQTPLPLVCFVDRSHPQGRTASYVDRIAKAVVASGKAWISTTRIGNGQPVLRACITNYRTSAADIATLVTALNHARAQKPTVSR